MFGLLSKPQGKKASDIRVPKNAGAADFPRFEGGFNF
jgi:hypothetical protein